MKVLCYYLAVIFGISAFLLSLTWLQATRDTNEATIAKACIDNGGEWIKNWGASYNCVKRQP